MLQAPLQATLLFGKMEEVSLNVVVLGEMRQTLAITVVTKFRLAAISRILGKRLGISTGVSIVKSESDHTPVPLTMKVSDYLVNNGTTVYAVLDGNPVNVKVQEAVLSMSHCVSPSIYKDRLRKCPDNFGAVCDQILRNDVVEPKKPIYQEPIILPGLDVRETTSVRKQNVDLHDYTREEAKVVIRRALLNLDRSFTYEIKFLVGRGVHSGITGFIMDKVLEETCRELGFASGLTQSTASEGYYVLRVEAEESP